MKDKTKHRMTYSGAMVRYGLLYLNIASFMKDRTKHRMTNSGAMARQIIVFKHTSTA